MHFLYSLDTTGIFNLKPLLTNTTAARKITYICNVFCYVNSVIVKKLTVTCLVAIMVGLYSNLWWKYTICCPVINTESKPSAFFSTLIFSIMHICVQVHATPSIYLSCYPTKAFRLQSWKSSKNILNKSFEWKIVWSLPDKNTMIEL